MHKHKSGFVGIFGKPNAGKSTLMNALLGEKLAITSHKAQTTRQHILGVLTQSDYQIVFTDTPGILERSYKLHDRMLSEIEQAKQGTDVALFLVDIKDHIPENIALLEKLHISSPIIVLLTKQDKYKKETEGIANSFRTIPNVKEVLVISSKTNYQLAELIQVILQHLPIGPPFYPNDTLTDKPTRFFVAELVRERLFENLDEELPYHCAVIIQRFEEKNTLTKIVADIVVSRESQKGILLGHEGKMIRKIGQEARQEIEKFIDRKVFLELHVKVRKDWRNNELYLKEYGY